MTPSIIKWARTKPATASTLNLQDTNESRTHSPSLSSQGTISRVWSTLSAITNQGRWKRQAGQKPARLVWTVRHPSLSRRYTPRDVSGPGGILPVEGLRDQAAAGKSLQLCPTLRPNRRQPTRLLCPWNSPGKNTGVGCQRPREYPKA